STPYGIRQILTAKFLQLRLVIEELQLRWAAGLEEVDHTLRLRREMWQVRQAADGCIHVSGWRSGPAIFFQQRSQCGGAGTQAVSIEELSTCKLLPTLIERADHLAAHCFVETSSRLRIKLATTE